MQFYCLIGKVTFLKIPTLSQIVQDNLLPRCSDLFKSLSMSNIVYRHTVVTNLIIVNTLNKKMLLLTLSMNLLLKSKKTLLDHSLVDFLVSPEEGVGGDDSEGAQGLMGNWGGGLAC